VGQIKAKVKSRILKLEFHPPVVWAVVQLVGGSGCAGMGHMEYAEGRELRGQVRVASARKNTEAHQKPHAVAPFFCLLFLGCTKKSRSPKA
jgi:hypothetical protein